MNATIVTVGDEILIGQVVDTNSAWLGSQLVSLGIDVAEIRSISDKEEPILEAIGTAFQQSDLVFMTGGLGPTKDDITKKAIAKYFNASMVFHEPTFEVIKAMFIRFNRSMSESHMEQCYMPDNAVILPNNMGTAPGMLFHQGEKMLFSMPGVPFEMKAIFEDNIKEILIQKTGNTAFIHHRTLMTVGQGETALADKIQYIVDTFPPQISMAYLPSLGSVRLRITGKSTSPSIKEEVEHYASLVEKEVDYYVYGYDNETLEDAVKRMIDQKKWTLATAESCTGGYLAHRLTSIPGSSSYFQGSIVSYSNTVKQNLLGVKAQTLDSFGAVSEETVLEMAEGCKNRLNVDIAISISGIAGPDGGSPEKPVGTVWFAIAYPGENTKAYKITASKDRLKNIEYAANVIMGKLLRKLAAKEFSYRLS